ncbi:hypothetical protein K3495_g14163 [Podosphaera aphanis]|nr:hypothetical protein K3495_g14163 [Podosphaera aphanis]
MSDPKAYAESSKTNQPKIENDEGKFDPALKEQADTNAWISKFMSEVELVEYFNDDLLEVFNEEFVNFNDAHFKKCGDIILRKLKNFLYDRGVYVRKSNISHVKSLSETLGKESNICPPELVNPSMHVGSYKTNNFVSPRVVQSQKNIEKYFSKKERSMHKSKGKETRKYDSEGDVAQSSIVPEKPKSELSFKLTGMSKLYNSSEKYTGSELDNLDFKFQIFKQKCDIQSILVITIPVITIFTL